MQAQIAIEQNDWVIRLPKRFISQNALLNLLQSIENNAAFSTEAEQAIVLSTEEWGRFIQTLENPPQPTATLKEALKEYKKVHNSTDNFPFNSIELKKIIQTTQAIEGYQPAAIEVVKKVQQLRQQYGIQVSPRK